MLKTPAKYIIIAALLALAPTLAAASDMDPAPADRVGHQWRKDPGELKHDRFGVLDPSPDVIPLDYLPTDKYGFIDWARAMDEGLIKPRATIRPDDPAPPPPPKVGDVIIRSKMKFMPDVLFPHEPHTVWLKCENCHPGIFEKKAGATPITMDGIWKGEYCGRCHDKVAFPTRNCFRCHSVPRGGR